MSLQSIRLTQIQCKVGGIGGPYWLLQWGIVIKWSWGSGHGGVDGPPPPLLPFAVSRAHLAENQCVQLGINTENPVSDDAQYKEDHNGFQ